MFIQRTNDKSCVLDAFANATGILASELIDLIGHDGSVNGFHVQELIEAMSELCYSVTEIQLIPVAYTLDDPTEREIVFPQGNLKRFMDHMEYADGVLLGENTRGQPHAIAWRGRRCIDSNGFGFPMIRINQGHGNRWLDTTHFNPHTFLKLYYE